MPRSLTKIGNFLFPDNQVTLVCDCDNSVVTDWFRNSSDKNVDTISLYLLHSDQENRSETPVDAVDGVVSVEYDCAACGKHVCDLETTSEILYRGGINHSDVTWKIDASGHLLFGGGGDMNPEQRNFTGLIPAQGKETVTEVVFQDGIEDAGYSLCSGLDALTGIVFPDSMKKISFASFKGCSALSEVRIPSHIKTIEQGAFSGCTNLSTLVLEEGIETIGYSAFQNCPALKSVYIPNTVTNIDPSAFGELLVDDGEGGYFVRNYQFIIQGQSGSAANEVADQYDMIFVPVDDHLDHLEDSGLPMETVETREATCGQEGLTNGIICAVCGGLLTAEEIIPKTDHIWGDPEWIWSDAGENCSAIAKYTCENDSTHTETVDAVVSTSTGNGEDEGYNIYTATVVHDDHTYTDVKKILNTEALIQPQDVYVNAIGEQAVITIETPAAGLTYQWYYKNAGSSKFLVSSNTTSVYSVKVTEKVKNRLVYCMITDAYGNKVTTDTVGIYVNMPLEIIQEPQNAIVSALGEKATVSVIAKGTGLTYQWYYKNTGSSKFLASTNKTPTYSVTVNERVKNRQVYCEITDAFGEKVITNTVRIYIYERLEILAQPQNVFVNSLGEKATVSVTAKGTGLIYQWYYKNTGSSRFLASTNKTPTYSVTVNDRVKNRQVYCKITDISGQVLTTDTVTIRVYEPLEIIVQPENVSVGALNEKATVSVVAKGMGLTYQWYYKNTNSSRFLPSSNTTAYYTVTVNTRVVDRKVYCVITDMNGESVTTDTVTITVAE